MKKRSLLFIFLSLIMMISVFSGITMTVTADDNTPIEYSMGDANLDGNVNTRDVVLIKQSIVGLAELNDKQKVFADVYADGQINTRDVVLIQQSIVGMEVDLGVHEHSFENGVCICGYVEPHTHNYSELKFDVDSHWYECSCGDKNGLEGHKGGSATCQVNATCSVCGEKYGTLGSHHPKTEWVTTETHHYHECKTSGCTEKLNYGEHNFDSNKKCSSCDYVTTALLGTEISSNIYEIDGTNLFAKVPNAQTNFSFAKTINVAKGATYKVYTDISCKEEYCMPSYVVNDLKEGNNVYYFLVSNGDEIPQVYTVTVRRKPMYTVTFNTDGGSYVAPQTIEEDALATKPNNPTKTGYDFVSWDYDFNTAITGNKTIKASWSINQYTITFVLNNGKENVVIKQNYNTRITAPVPTKIGHTFTTWDKSVPSVMPAENMTITANWKLNQYSITIVYGNGQGNKIITQDYNSDVEEIDIPERLGYTFDGWDKEIPVKMPAEDVIITANWDAIEYDIDYNLNKGKLTTDKNKYTIEQAVVLDNPTRDYYIFSGWYDNANFSGNATTGIMLGTYGDVELYAKWTPINYDITYVLNGGTNDKNNPTKYNVETSTITLNNPTRDGYTFDGWYLEEAFNTKVIQIEQGSHGNVKLYAKWNIVEYDIIYNLNGGKLTTEKNKYTIEEAVTFDTPTRDYYTFSGWYDNADFGGNAVTGIVVGTYNDIELYAKWTPIEYTITSHYGYNVKMEIVPENAYTVTNNSTYPWSLSNGVWSSGNKGVNSSNSVYKITANSNVTVTFDYKVSSESTYDKLIIALNGTEKVKISGSTSYVSYSITLNAGDSLTFTYSKDYSDHKNDDKAYIKNLTYIVEPYITTTTYNIETPTITLENLTRDGYTFNGWFTEETFKNQVTEIPLGSYGDKTFYAKWSANTVSYKIEYYLQNFADDEYTLTEITTDYGLTDTTATIEPKDITHFTFNEGYSLNVLESNINGDGSTVLKVYYTRNKYTLSINNSNAGEITNTGTYKYGSDVKISEMTLYLGYDFIGWYSGEELLSTDLTYTFIVDKNIIAKFEVKEEMANFNFTSTTTTCQITGIKDKTVTEIIVPNYVTAISSGAFSACDELESITLPFVGAKAGVTSSDTYQYPFGYIFGTSSYTGSYGTTQYYYGSSTSITTNSTYKIPSSLKSVTITSGNILYGAFYNCTALKSIEIPDSVTSIGSSAFENCSSLTSIEIPDSVTSIGSSAFYKCTALKSVVIGDSVTRIGDYAFSGCTSLNSVVIGDSVTSIGDYAFYYCTALTDITVDGNNQNYKSIDGNLYTKDGKTLIQYAIGKEDTSFVIPNGVTSIGSSAFYKCTALKSVVIGDSVTRIGSSAFSNCDSLNSVVIGDSVTSIGDYAFYYCTALTDITVDGNNQNYKSIDGNLYTKDGKTLIQYAIGKEDTSFVIPNGVTSIGDYAFYYCYSLKSIEIPDSVTSIGSSAFENCSSLKSVVIGDSVTSIGYDAFSNCDSLTSVVIGDSVTSIDSNAFYDCDSLTSVVIGDSVTRIGVCAFDNCDSLIRVVIPNSVTSIGADAFRDCSLLTIYCEVASEPGGWNIYWNGSCPVVLGYQYAYIDGIMYGIKNGEAAVVNQSRNITTATIPSSITYKGNTYSVTRIGSSAFSGCTSLTSIEIPNSVTSIGDYAFRSCTALTEIKFNAINCADLSSSNYVFADVGKNGTGIKVTFGNKVREVPAYLFYPYISASAPKITEVVFEEGSVCNSIGPYAFAHCSSLTSIEIPNSVTSIGYGAFSTCTSLTSVEIPNSVTSIGNYAFSSCDSLTSIKYRGTQTQWSAISKGSNWNYGTGNYTITYNYTGE